MEQREIDQRQQEWIAERAVGRCLHVGCGMKRIEGAVNVDANPERRRWADVACDAQLLPFADASFDSVVSSHMVEHLRDPIAALQEMARVLCTGGVMAHVIPDRRHTPHRESTRYPFAHHHHEWSGPEDFRWVLDQVAGLRIVALESFAEFRWSFKVEAVAL